MKKWMSKIIILAIVLFVAANLYLIFKDKSTVARSFYIDKWTTAKEQRLLETMQTEGVSVPSEEQFLYYDNSKGSFEGFLVKKGQEIRSGDSLFLYSTDSYEETIAQLESEKTSLEKQITGLEDKIDNLIDLQRDSSFGIDEEIIINDLSVEIDLYQTEAEISRLESEIEKYDELIATADEKLPNLEEISDMDGVVKDINQDLSNPIITIASSENKVKGTLSEAQHGAVEKGMEVIVSLAGENKTYKGVVEQVSFSPEGEPKVDKESQYPFSIMLDEEPEDMAHGTHVGVKIITNEIQNAITVPYDSIKKMEKAKQVFILNNGKVERRKVTTGLHVNNVQEIKSGLEEGESLSQAPLRYEKGIPTFYTPLKVKDWDKSMYSDMRKLEIVKGIGKGFLSM